MAPWSGVTCGWLSLVAVVYPAILSLQSRRAQVLVLGMPAYSLVTLSSSLVATPRWTTPILSTTLCTFSIHVSPLSSRSSFLLTLPASRQWSRASPPGPKPAGRYGHTLNILGSKIYIFGGQVEGLFFNDLIAFDLNALQNPVNQWEFLIPNTDDSLTSAAKVPPARTNHTIVSYNDQLYL